MTNKNKIVPLVTTAQIKSDHDLAERYINSDGQQDVSMKMADRESEPVPGAFRWQEIAQSGSTRCRARHRCGA